MKYGDENAIIARREAIKQSQWDISQNVKIKNLSLTFSGKEFSNYGISIILPDQLEVMAPEIARLKYPSEFRPDLILTLMNQNIDFTFKYVTDEDILPENIEKYTKSLRMAMRRMNPSVIYEPVKIVHGINVLTPYYTYQIPAYDADLYCVIFTASIQEHLLLGGFNCIYEEREPWIRMFPQILSTLCDLSQQPDKTN